MARVLVLSPHPDDEAIGCGGTLSRHVADGDLVHVVFLTSGEAGGHGVPAIETGRIRESEAIAAGSILGTAPPAFWRLPDGKLRATAALRSRVEKLLADFSPDYVYTTHPGEQHPDHQAAPRVLQQVLANMDARRPLVRMFEVWTPLAHMDHIEDISAFMDVKLRAIRAYATQCAVLRFDEAVTGLNRYRGEMHSWPGGDYAEVFAELQR